MDDSSNDKDLMNDDAVASDKLHDSDHYGNRFSELGKKLLTRINRTNVITVEQFMPFIELFKRDDSKLDGSDRQYLERMHVLFERYKRELDINLYEPTVVINSKEDPSVVVWLGKCYSYVAPDNLSEANRRDNINASVMKSPRTTREEITLKASLSDLHDANVTEEQTKSFRDGKLMSAIVNGMFFKSNLSEEAKLKVEADLKGLDSSDEVPKSLGFVNEEDFFLDDGE